MTIISAKNANLVFKRIIHHEGYIPYTVNLCEKNMSAVVEDLLFLNVEQNIKWRKYESGSSKQTDLIVLDIFVITLFQISSEKY